MPATFTRFVLAERPTEHITSSTFSRETASFINNDDLKPGPSQVLVKVDWLSLDPAMRGWLNDTRSYIPPVKIGQVMRALGLGTVVAAGENSKFQVGQIVRGTLGWTEYAVMKDKDVELIRLPPNAQALDYLGPLGMTGMTAYFGLLDVGKIRPNETLVVSGAAGAVGSLVCQIGKLKGARVIGIAGSDDKCKWLESELGVDKAINYKNDNFHDEFKESVGYLDVFFDNVGGDILNFALTRLKQKARIVLCGAISAYNSSKPKGLTSYLTLIAMRAKIEGFVVFDYASQYAMAEAEIAQWIAEGKVKRKFHIVDGLDKAPEALPLLFSGGNMGKLVVRVSDEAEKSRL